MLLDTTQRFPQSAPVRRTLQNLTTGTKSRRQGTIAYPLDQRRLDLRLFRYGSGEADLEVVACSYT